MKKITFLFLFVVVSCHKLEYSDADTTTIITTLNNDYVRLKKDKIQGYTIDNKATAVLKLKNRNKLFLLTNNLTQMDRALISHVLLTKIIEPWKDSLAYDFKYNKTKDTLLSTTYKLNGMKWRVDANGKNVIVDYNPGGLNEYWLARM
jgi:hypothetical protein